MQNITASNIKIIKNRNVKKHPTSKYLSSLEIKKFLIRQKNLDFHEFNIRELQTLYRFFDEKLDSITHSYDTYSPSNDCVFDNERLHLAILTVMKDLSILIDNDFNYDYIKIILESFKYSFPIGSKDYNHLKNDIKIYGSHLHDSVLSYFQQ